jgi:hypothetical protein
MGDGRVIVFIAGVVALEVAIEPSYTLWHFIYGPQSDRYTVIGKREFGSR